MLRRVLEGENEVKGYEGMGRKNGKVIKNVRRRGEGQEKENGEGKIGKKEKGEGRTEKGWERGKKGCIKKIFL